MAGRDQVPKDFRRVVVAAAVGNTIEWYDFYIFGSLAAILSVKFFDKTLPHRGAGGVFRHLLVHHAGNAPHQHREPGRKQAARS